MLAPIPDARLSIASWQQARQQLTTTSTDLRHAEADLLRAEALYRQSLSALLPDLRLSASAAFDLDNPDTAPGVPAVVDGRRTTAPVGTASLSLSQSLIDVASWRGRDAAATSRRASEWSLFDVRRRISQRLAATLVAVVTAERVAELNRLGLLQSLERANLSQRTFELGRATELDVVRARQDVAVARSALIAGDEQLRGAREALGVALGSGDQVGVRKDFRLDGILEELSGHCRGLGTSELRADEEAATTAVKSAQQRTAAARATRLPTLDLTSNLFAVTTDPDVARVASWSIAAVLSLPLWDGGLRAAQIKERAALEADTQASAEEVRRSARFEISRSRRAVSVAQSLVSVATEGRTLAERLDTMTRRSFEIGRATSLELVQSAVALRQAELALALRQFEWMQARLDALLTEARCDS
jgi:outer membrane protein TolC